MNILDKAVVNKQSSLPRHAQIEAHFRSLIASGRLGPGDRIPAEMEIAQALGVSRMTVNKALLALTREGLFQRERGLGTYVAPVGEPGTRHLTVMVPLDHRTANDEQDCYFGPLCRSIQAAAEERQDRVSLAYLPDGSYADYQNRHPADGWLLISPDRSRLDDLRALRRICPALVVVGSRWEGLVDVPTVDSDNVTGASEAVRFLHGLGHRRIALVYAGPEASNTADRVAGYRQTLRENGLAADPSWEVEADSAEQLGSGAVALEALLGLEADRRPTAIFAAGYYLALETINLARRLGMPVPEALSVVGYDDPYSARLAYPPLTTLRQPLAEMGQAAVALLDAQMRHPESGSSDRLILLPPHFQRRGSAARPQPRAEALVPLSL